MKVINMLKGIITGLYASLKRFPIAIGLSAAAAVLLMVLNHYNQSFGRETEEMIGRIVMVLALGIPVSLCTKLVFERKGNIGLMLQAGIYLLEAAGLALYYMFLLRALEMVPVTRYTGISLAFYMGFLFIPYFFSREGFELYVIKLMTRFFTAVIYSVVLYLGTAAILFTIDKLLEIKVDRLVYFDVWLGVVWIFAVSFFLAGVPAYKEQFEADSYPKLLKVLLLYIVMPIISIYTAILYIYFAKILVTLQWPIGLVAHLVLWYSVICAGVIFLISPIDEDNKWARTFAFLLPKLILPLIIMMFVSMGIRIKAYGLTENRYYVLALGLWALGVMLNFNFSKGRRNIILPVSLALVAFLSVVGPWSSYSLAKLSQNQRLEGILAKYDMIKDNSIVKPLKEVSTADKKEISEILYYFSASHSLDDVKYLPEGFKISQMEDVFGFDSTRTDIWSPFEEYFAYSSDLTGPIDIEGYSYLYTPGNYLSPEANSGSRVNVIFDRDVQEVAIKSGGREVYRKSLLEFGKQLHKKHSGENKGILAVEEMTLTDENEYVKVKLIFAHISGNVYEDSEDIIINSMDFYILVALKQ